MPDEFDIFGIDVKLIRQYYHYFHHSVCLLVPTGYSTAKKYLPNGNTRRITYSRESKTLLFLKKNITNLVTTLTRAHNYR